MLDIHTHILPGVDDGATDYAMAVEMLKAARQAGIDKIVTTPHVYKIRGVGQFQSAYGRLYDSAKEIGILLIPGCELSVRALAGSVISSEILAPFQIGITHFVLLEFPDTAPPVDWEYLVSDINRSGYHVIIAHPERYQYFAKSLSRAQGLLNYGCELQLDALSFLRGKFSSQRRVAIKLLDSGFASYIASDAHRPDDYGSFLSLRRYLGNHWPTDGQLDKIL
jgi:protein-tyrosine phosphatase